MLPALFLSLFYPAPAACPRSFPPRKINHPLAHSLTHSHRLSSYTPRSLRLRTRLQPQPHRRILSQIPRSNRPLPTSRFSRYFYRFCLLFTARSARRIRLAPSLRIWGSRVAPLASQSQRTHHFLRLSQSDTLQLTPTQNSYTTCWCNPLSPATPGSSWVSRTIAACRQRLRLQATASAVVYSVSVANCKAYWTSLPALLPRPPLDPCASPVRFTKRSKPSPRHDRARPHQRSTHLDRAHLNRAHPDPVPHEPPRLQSAEQRHQLPHLVFASAVAVFTKTAKAIMNCPAACDDFVIDTLHQSACDISPITCLWDWV